MNRALPVPPYGAGVSAGVLTIKTAEVTLSYVVGGAFNASTLSVTTLSGYSWHAGAAGYGNNLGTIKSLDELSVISLNCSEIANKTVHQESLHCAWGLTSRDGWSIIDDTGAPVMDANDWWAANVVNVDDADWYGLFHGLDYKAALGDYVLIGGKIAMTPRYATGIWFTRCVAGAAAGLDGARAARRVRARVSPACTGTRNRQTSPGRWYDYDSRSAREIVLKYKARSIPLDVGDA